MTTAWNIFGFHLDPTSAPTGFGDSQRALARAGIDLMAMAADTYGPIYETLNIAQEEGVGATVVWRPTGGGQANGYDYDVPGRNYSLPVQEAADLHWSMVAQVTPPEMDRRVAWTMHFNEIDKGRLSYCAAISENLARRHVAEGTRGAFLAMNSGEPEPNQWEQPEVLSFLRFASQHPHNVALALHEYSFDLDIRQGYPWLVGRFLTLKDICDRHGIDFSAVTIFITEFGHGRDEGTFPGVPVAIEDIEWAAELYGQYNNIRLAAYWLISNNQTWGTLGQLTVPMIPILTDRILEGAPYPPYEPGSGTTQPPDCIEREDYRAVVDIVPQNATRAELAQVANAIFDTKGTVTFSHNDARKVAALGNERSLVRIWAVSRQPHTRTALEEWGIAYELKEFSGDQPPPTIPPTPKYDLLAYMKGVDRFHAELQYTWDGGGTHPIQVQYAPQNVFYYVKGGGQYEMLYHDSQWIYRGIDTSEAADRFYTQNTIVNNSVYYGAMWAKRFMAIGETVNKRPFIEHWIKGNPPTLDKTGQANDNLTLVAHYPTYRFPSGVQVQDVIFLSWNSNEGYFFARGMGLVGFKFAGGESYISEIHNDRPDLERDVVEEWEQRPRYYL